MLIRINLREKYQLGILILIRSTIIKLVVRTLIKKTISWVFGMSCGDISDDKLRHRKAEKMRKRLSGCGEGRTSEEFSKEQIDKWHNGGERLFDFAKCDSNDTSY